MLYHDQSMQQIHGENFSVNLYTKLAYALTKVSKVTNKTEMDVLKHNKANCFYASDSKSQHKDCHLSGIFLDHNATNM